MSPIKTLESLLFTLLFLLLTFGGICSLCQVTINRKKKIYKIVFVLLKRFYNVFRCFPGQWLQPISAQCSIIIPPKAWENSFWGGTEMEQWPEMGQIILGNSKKLHKILNLIYFFSVSSYALINSFVFSSHHKNTLFKALCNALKNVT